MFFAPAVDADYTPAVAWGVVDAGLPPVFSYERRASFRSDLLRRQTVCVPRSRSFVCSRRRFFLASRGFLSRLKCATCELLLSARFVACDFHSRVCFEDDKTKSRYLRGEKEAKTIEKRQKSHNVNFLCVTEAKDRAQKAWSHLMTSIFKHRQNMAQTRSEFAPKGQKMPNDATRDFWPI